MPPMLVFDGHSRIVFIHPGDSPFASNPIARRPRPLATDQVRVQPLSFRLISGLSTRWLSSTIPPFPPILLASARLSLIISSPGPNPISSPVVPHHPCATLGILPLFRPMPPPSLSTRACGVPHRPCPFVSTCWPLCHCIGGLEKGRRVVGRNNSPPPRSCLVVRPLHSRPR